MFVDRPTPVIKWTGFFGQHFWMIIHVKIDHILERR